MLRLEEALEASCTAFESSMGRRWTNLEQLHVAALAMSLIAPPPPPPMDVLLRTPAGRCCLREVQACNAIR